MEIPEILADVPKTSRMTHEVDLGDGYRLQVWRAPYGSIVSFQFDPQGQVMDPLYVAPWYAQLVPGLYRWWLVRKLRRPQ
jgi:hypothetical protein